MLYAAGCTSELLLSYEVYAHTVNVGLLAVVGFEERVGQVVDVDVGLGDAVACEQIEDVLDNRTVGDRGQGFGTWPVSGKSLVPLPAASTPPSSKSARRRVRRRLT